MGPPGALSQTTNIPLTQRQPSAPVARCALHRGANRGSVQLFMHSFIPEASAWICLKNPLATWSVAALDYTTQKSDILISSTDNRVFAFLHKYFLRVSIYSAEVDYALTNLFYHYRCRDPASKKHMNTLEACEHCRCTVI